MTDVPLPPVTHSAQIEFGYAPEYEMSSNADPLEIVHYGLANAMAALPGYVGTKVVRLALYARSSIGQIWTGPWRRWPGAIAVPLAGIPPAPLAP